jgi:uncharacterized protein YuzE
MVIPLSREFSEEPIMGIEIIDASKLIKANPLNEIVIKIQDKAEA